MLLDGGNTDIAALHCVHPPPWASLQVKLAQQFFKHKLHPPADIFETASFLAINTFVQQRLAVAFVARSVGEHVEREGLFTMLKLPVQVDLPPVG